MHLKQAGAMALNISQLHIFGCKSSFCRLITLAAVSITLAWFAVVSFSALFGLVFENAVLVHSYEQYLSTIVLLTARKSFLPFMLYFVRVLSFQRTAHTTLSGGVYSAFQSWERKCSSYTHSWSTFTQYSCGLNKIHLEQFRSLSHRWCCGPKQVFTIPYTDRGRKKNCKDHLRTATKKLPKL